MTAVSIEEKTRTSETVPRVRLITEIGDMVLDLYSDRAPATVAAFLEYVDTDRYRDGLFNRAVRLDNDRGEPLIEVIQAYVSGEGPPTPGIDHETTAMTGLAHEDGTVSLARGAPGTATPATFFICIGSQPALDFGGRRTADGLGFAAFGRVVEGREVARAIQTRPTLLEDPEPYVRGQMIADPVRIHRIRREAADAIGRLRELADDYWAFRIREFPVEASGASVASASRRLDGGRIADHDRRGRLCMAMLARARTIAPGDLSSEDKATLDAHVRALIAKSEADR
jgi:peptidyl-prolyl cis-trans isomerase A (cyclophilin A)